MYTWALLVPSFLCFIPFLSFFVFNLHSFISHTENARNGNCMYKEWKMQGFICIITGVGKWKE